MSILTKIPGLSRITAIGKAIAVAWKVTHKKPEQLDLEDRLVREVLIARANKQDVRWDEYYRRKAEASNEQR